MVFSQPGGARELKLQPFDSESKTTSGCSNSLFSKKTPLTVYFHFTIPYKFPLLYLQMLLYSQFSRRSALYFPLDDILHTSVNIFLPQPIKKKNSKYHQTGNYSQP